MYPCTTWAASPARSGARWTYAITRDEAAIDAAARFLKDERDGLRQLMDAGDLLADQPRSEGRSYYEIKDETVTILVTHSGRIG